MTPTRYRSTLFVLCGLMLLGATPTATRAQEAVRAQEAAELQSPAAFLGYELGTQFTPHHRVVDYVRHVAAHSPSVYLEPYGTTYEGRPLLLAHVTTPDNLDRLDAIRTDNLRRAGMVEGPPQGPPTAIIWLSYNVHGNESVSAEAAMATLYDLANPAHSRTPSWLENTVVLLDPCLNPDGRERYVQWYNRTAGRTPNPTPVAREHHEPWPGGRTNHYYFDLNRDWAWGVQQETRQRLAAYHRWMPHVHVDFHEQGIDEPYYFAPAAEPFHENITEWQRTFQYTIGRNNARYFDRNNWLYFTREVFDLLYPGYGDTWPLFNGAVGMTYEQGGSGRAGLAVVTADGDTLTLADRIAHHHTTGLSTVEVTAQHHERVVQEFADYYQAAQDEPPGAYRTFVIRPDAQGDRLRALTAHLDRQHVRYGFATQERSARGFAYADGTEQRFVVQPGDLLVPLNQPKARLAKVLLEPKTTIVDSLTYDITAWGLPYAYGLEAYATAERLPLDADASPATASATTGPDRPYAYLSPWGSRADVQFAAALLQQDVKLRVAQESFTLDDRTYRPGTLVITRAGNAHMGARFDRIVRQAADSLEQSLHPVATGFVDRGPDFGSSHVVLLKKPRVAVLSGAPAFPNSVGEVWHYFDRVLHYPATLLRADDLDAEALTGVDVLVMPGGSYGDWLTSERTAALEAWIQRGGRLVAIGRANEALAGHAPFALVHKESGEDADNAEQDTTDMTLQRYSTRERRALSQATPGSIHWTRLDNSHPLGFGLGRIYYTLKRSSDAFAYLQEGKNVATLEEAPPVSGFMGHEAQQKMRETLVFGVQPLGDGQVVYLVDNPLFRGFWYGGQIVFSNAVFLVGSE